MPILTREVLRLLYGEIDGFVKRRLLAVLAVLAVILAGSVLAALAPLAFKLIIDGFTRSATGGNISALHLILRYAGSQWLAVHADEIIVLDDGAVVERGTHAGLLAQRGRYAALWQAQQAGGEERDSYVA